MIGGVGEVAQEVGGDDKAFDGGVSGPEPAWAEAKIKPLPANDNNPLDSVADHDDRVTQATWPNALLAASKTDAATKAGHQRFM